MNSKPSTKTTAARSVDGWIISDHIWVYEYWADYFEHQVDPLPISKEPPTLSMGGNLKRYTCWTAKGWWWNYDGGLVCCLGCFWYHSPGLDLLRGTWKRKGHRWDCNNSCGITLTTWHSPKTYQKPPTKVLEIRVIWLHSWFPDASSHCGTASWIGRGVLAAYIGHEGNWFYVSRIALGDPGTGKFWQGLLNW